MYQAIWNDVVLAETDTTTRVEGNHYFPPDSLKSVYFNVSPTTSHCPWKGTAKYYTLSVDGHQNADAAWYYPSPSPAAEHIRDYVAFWNGVRVVKARENPLTALCRRITTRK
ncbi:DUF427 domain-containing protein [Pseudarthrobacter sp. PH31-O2]|uniref:DUF427 domain-containing protein n=1 Tax=Micrococcaceae TaxID=1268 RepID=UPI0024B908B0|nr:DUF427 domain-containing protein [Pseudarthrobacter sp. PH31-O2]MDJ0354300.1 DUF427 domain-containing protein [Pseudarthrobacter sp. PH31-O2]